MLATNWTKSTHPYGKSIISFSIFKLQSNSLYTFDNGVQVLQLRSLNADQVTDEVVQLVESMGSLDAAQLAKVSGISLVLAAERLI